MKKFYVFCGVALLIVLSSCIDKDNDATSIVGEWRLCSIRTEIRDYPDPPGEDNQFNSDVFYTFKADSTYEIFDGDYDELGTWSFSDSVLTMTPNDSSENSVTSVRVVKLHGDSLIHESQSESDFGPIIEYMTFVKVGSINSPKK